MILAMKHSLASTPFDQKFSADSFAIRRNLKLEGNGGSQIIIFQRHSNFSLMRMLVASKGDRLRNFVQRQKIVGVILHTGLHHDIDGLTRNTGAKERIKYNCAGLHRLAV